MKEIDEKDSLRNQLIRDVFDTPMQKVVHKNISEDKVDVTAIKTQLENDIFAVLEKRGFSREKATGAVANFMSNLNRL